MRMNMKRMVIIVLVLMATTVTVFADVTNFGQNTGQVVLDNIWWLALAVIGFVLFGFLLKKAWTQAAIFAVIGSILMVFIKMPDKLLSIGNTLFAAFFQ